MLRCEAETAGASWVLACCLLPAALAQVCHWILLAGGRSCQAKPGRFYSCTNFFTDAILHIVPSNVRVDLTRYGPPYTYS